MKKQIILFVMISCLAFSVLAGCSQTADVAAASAPAMASSDNNSASSEKSEEPTITPSASADPAKSAGDKETVPEMEFKDVQFDQASNDYFDGDAKNGINQLYMLLNSAAMAEFAEGKSLYPDESPDISMEWAIVYQYINSYGESDKDIQKMEDGTLVVSEDKMLDIFNSLFSFFKNSLPELNTGYLINYDKDGGAYSIGRSDFGEVSFAVTGFSLSKASAEDSTISATVALTAFDIDGNSDGVVLVEIVPKADTMYGYSIQSLTKE